ncbi:hypothetical protein [Sphaerimonospora thailandensis]|uniref:Uncharacterized protein n=1 Tax=Sphaerimonospora thailandensis TaxID=795644 RepID=A0A8J3VXS3_9ACTN|nr:hypothetical protein [Sphaerimonospora thailandensis]GIH69229.1 hypothetical protein Mth01_14820 [Sphaerimonospora thailandensis]
MKRDASSLHYFGDPDEDELHRIRERYPGWKVWRGQSEKRELCGWYATRTHDLTNEQFRRGMRRTLDADTSVELTELLDEQQRLAQAL